MTNRHEASVTPIMSTRMQTTDAALKALEHDLLPVTGTAIQPINMVTPPDIGKLSAEAVRKQWEQTAKEVEDLGTMVKDLIGKLDHELKECDESLKLIAEAAKHVREKGDATHAVIDQASSLSKILRDICTDINKKVS